MNAQHEKKIQYSLAISTKDDTFLINRKPYFNHTLFAVSSDGVYDEEHLDFLHEQLEILASTVDEGGDYLYDEWVYKLDSKINTEDIVKVFIMRVETTIHKHFFVDFGYGYEEEY